MLFSYAIGLWIFAFVDLILVLISPKYVYGQTGYGRLFGINTAITRFVAYPLLAGLFKSADETAFEPAWPFFVALVVGTLWRIVRPRFYDAVSRHGQSEEPSPKPSAKQPEAPKPSPAPEQQATVKPTAGTDDARVPPGTPNAEALEATWMRIDRIRANAKGFSDPRVHDALIRIADTTVEIIEEVIEDPNDFSRAREALSHYLTNVDEVAADLKKLDEKGEAATPIADALPVLEATEAEFRRVKSALFDNDRFNLDVRLRHLKGKLNVDWTKVVRPREKKT